MFTERINRIASMTARALVLAAFVVPTVLSCNHGPVGIFASIEQERKIEDERELPNSISVNAITELGDYYFISAPTIYRRSTSNTTDGTLSQWEAVSPPASGMRNISLARLGNAETGSLIAVFAANDGGAATLYRRDGADDSWQAISLSGISGDLILISQDSGSASHLFLNVTAAPNDNRLYVTTDGSSFTPVVEAGETDPLFAPTPFIDVAYDGTAWWISSHTALYTGSTSELTGAGVTDATAAADFPEEARSFSGLFYGGPTGSEKLYLATEVGRIAVRDGGAWTLSADAVTTVSDEPVALTDFAFLESGDFGTVVVGTRYQGYREVDPEDFTIDVPSRDGNYQSSELASAVVLSFFVDSTNPDLPQDAPVDADLMFAGTAGMGLWKNFYDGSAAVWTRE